MKKYGVLIISFALLFVATVYFTFSITKDLNNYRDKKDQIATELNFEERLLGADSYIYELTGFGESPEDRFIELNSEADRLYSKAAHKGIYLAIIVSIYVMLNVFFYNKRDHKMQIRGLIMVSSATVFLYLGLQSPFLEMFAYNYDLEIDLKITSVVFDGRTYYLYQNKSILQLITMLYNGGNYLVAVCLLLFSIVFPLFKLLSSTIVFLAPHGKYAENAVAVINKIGKWSMADVFVSAIFLAYFSFANMNVGVDTGAVTLIGTYFFLAFVVLSIASGAFLKKVVKLDPDSTDL